MKLNKTALLATVALVAASTVLSAQSTGIVREVVTAPIVPDGNVAGAITDIVLNLDRSMDPSVLGRTLLKDKQIRITLPPEFVNVKGHPALPITSGCLATTICNTIVLLPGWPQNPISPPLWTVSSPGTNPDGSTTFTVQALEDVASSPGIKQIHLLLMGFINPAAGFYDIIVESETGVEEALETATARVEILARTRPVVSVTSVFFGPTPRPNQIYQETGVSSPAPVPFEMLLWNTHGRAMRDVKVVATSSGQGVGVARLVQRGRFVGEIRMVGPRGATGFGISAPSRSVEVSAPVLGVPAARLTANFTTGDLPGLYTVEVDLDQGNSMTFFVMAVE